MYILFLFTRENFETTNVTLFWLTVTLSLFYPPLLFYRNVSLSSAVFMRVCVRCVTKMRATRVCSIHYTHTHAPMCVNILQSIHDSYCFDTFLIHLNALYTNVKYQKSVEFLRMKLSIALAKMRLCSIRIYKIWHFTFNRVIKRERKGSDFTRVKISFKLWQRRIELRVWVELWIFDIINRK